MKLSRIDKPFLISVIILALGGFFIFTSASLGLLAREGVSFVSVASNQLTALILGLILMFVISRFDYKKFRKWAFYIFVATVILNILVFIPGLSVTHGGATRWIDLKFITIQPSEFLKIAFIIYFAAWLSSVKEKVTSAKYGLFPFITIMALLGAILLKQSDTNTFMVIFTAGLAMIIVAGARFRDILIMVLIAGIAIAGVAYFRPYARQRIMTFLNPGADPLGAGYQIQQSLIAVGSGKVFGRGFGQSIQKFNYLPEPIGDSIFAVASEEFGFIGAISLIALFIFFSFRGLKIATRISDSFGRLVIIGIVILITIESFMNIASMLGVIPLTGKPLLFVSHGGTALLITLAEVGIIFNISRFQRKIN